MKCFQRTDGKTETKKVTATTGKRLSVSYLQCENNKRKKERKERKKVTVTTEIRLSVRYLRGK